MKIRDLNKDEYVIVYDLSKSEYSGGMTVVGKVTELEYNNIDENEATIESVPFNEYTITDDNYFDLWSNYIEGKTEHIAFDKENTEKARKLLSNDLQQRKRKVSFEGARIPNSNKAVRWKDNGKLEVQSSYELDVPDYILKDENPDVIGYLSKQIKNKENDDFIEEIIKNYNPVVAYYVGKSIDNLRENEIDNARDLLNKAFENWEQ